jgi:tetratricopeptide (TPR) repeat protein
MIKFITALCLFVPASLCASAGVAIFPCENRTGDPRADWIGYAAADALYRVLTHESRARVWDPVFLFSADSAGWRMHSDSALARHAARWKWSHCVGGGYTVDGDSIWIRIRLAVDRDGRIEQSGADIAGSSGNFTECIKHIIEALGRLSAGDLAVGRLSDGHIAPNSLKAYGAYAAGLGYEMHGRFARALSAYEHAVRADDKLALAWVRISRIERAARRFDKAEAAAQKALDAAPRDPGAVAAYAEAAFEHEGYQKLQAFVAQNTNLLEQTPEGMRVIGRVRIASGNYQRAIAMLTRAVAAGPANLEADFALGQAYQAAGQFEAASAVFRRLIAYRPAHIRYYAFLGEAYRRSGRLMESNSILQRALALEPDNTTTLVSLANTYFHLGWYEKAQQLLVRARELKPNMAEVHVNLGVICWHRGLHDTARQAFERAARGERHVQAALVNQANIAFLGGDIKKAIRGYHQAEKSGPKDERMYFNLGLAFLARNQLKRAAACFDEVLYLSPHRLDAAIHAARIAELLHRESDAERHYRTILELAGSHRVALQKLTALLRRAARYEEAVTLVETYLETTPHDRELRLLLPRIYRDMQWYEVAVMEYDNLTKDAHFAENPAVYLGLGKSMYDLIRFKGGGDYDLTIARLKKAAQLDPRNPEPHLLIAAIYADYKGMPSLALDHWKQALRLSTDRKQRAEIQALIAEARQ